MGAMQMKQAPYSLWPEGQVVSLRRFQVELIAVSFVAVAGCRALSPYVYSYFGSLVGPMAIEQPALQQADAKFPTMPAPTVAAQLETLLQKAKEYGAVQQFSTPARERAGNAARRDVALPPRAVVADIPLPIPRPPDVEEVSRAMTAFAEPSDKLAARNDFTPPTKLASASVAKQPVHRAAYRSVASKREVTIYHLPDGRQFRIYGRLLSNDRGVF